MKLTVLGATGAVGVEIVRQAIDLGHEVTAIVRSPEGLKAFGSRITVVRGDLLNGGELAVLLDGSEAVLSGFGPRLPLAKEDDDLLRRFALSLTTAMRQSDVRRVVVVSTAFLFKDAIFPPANLFGRLFFPSVVTDAAGMEDIFLKAGLDCTIVRPPQLTNKPHTGKYRVVDGHLPTFGFNISRADVAGFTIKTLSDPNSFGKIIGVSN